MSLILAESAGLSSLTVARLRVALEAKLAIPLPPTLLLQAATARGLAASLLRRARAEAGTSSDSATAADGDAQTQQPEEEDSSMLLAEGVEAMTRGELRHAAKLCSRAATLMSMAIPPLATPPPPRAHVPLLALLAAVHDRLEEDDEALAAYSAQAAALGPTHTDAAVVHAQIMRLASRRGDHTKAAASASASVSAAHDAAAKAAAAAVASISNGKWVYLPPTWPSLPLCAHRLRHICLAVQDLPSFPPALCDLRHLRVLDVSGNRIRTLPEELSGLVEVRELTISGNDLVTLPECLATLPQLRSLAMQSNCFLSLPPVVQRCRKLTSLKWGAQRRGDAAAAAEAGDGAATEAGDGAVIEAAENAPPSLASPTLAMLELEVNEQYALPALNPTNTVLISLLASFNRLRAPPAGLNAYGRSLKKLHLGCNSIQCVAALLPSMTRLVELTLEGNELTALPDAIGRLAKLKELWVHGNRIEALPDALGKCASLTVLQCHHNRLSELPDAMAQLTKLQGLYLQSNRLCSLASLNERVLRHMPLQNLGLGNNCFDLAEAFDIDGARVGLGWNHGTPPRALGDKLSMWFASCDHVFEPHCAGVRAPLLLVAFAAQGPGMQQWLAPVLGCRSSGVQLDALFVADPSNSYYLQVCDAMPPDL